MVLNIVIIVFSLPQLSPLMMNVCYHTFAWGFPVLMVVIALGRKVSHSSFVLGYKIFVNIYYISNIH